MATSTKKVSKKTIKEPEPMTENAPDAAPKMKKTSKKSSAKKKKSRKTSTKKTKAKTSSKKTTTKRKTSTTKKKTSSKATTKKPKLEVYKLAQNAPNERYFMLANGKPVKHVAELAVIVADLEDHVFHHHVNPERNDFYTWVKDVFKDIELAKKLLGVDNKEKLQLVIYKHAAHKAFQKR